VKHPSTAPLPGFIRRLAAAASATPLSDDACLERFTACGDEAAFETLVRRHGPVVFRLCRGVLGDAHAAEDAFQATFLILARRAARLRKQRSLDSWLYKVAYRVALRARRKEAVQASRAEGALVRKATDPLDEVSWREVQAIFFEEMARLPDRYRAPLRLCCLEGKTRDEAAEMLGCGLCTLKSRLERGRKLFRERLSQRGLALSAGLLTMQLPAASAAVPASLLAATTRAGLVVRTGKDVRGFVPDRVVALCGNAHGLAVLNRIAIGAFLTICVTAAAATGVLLRPPPAAELSGDEQARRPGEPTAAGGVRTDVYGDPLPAEAISRLATVRFRHASWVSSVRFTPDGKTIVSCGADGVRAWDVVTGKQALFIPGSKIGDNFASAPVSPDGKLIATASDAAGVRLWDVATGKLLRGIGGSAEYLVSFSPDGKQVVTVGTNPRKQVQLLDVDTGKLSWSWSEGKQPFNRLAFTPDGKEVVVSTGVSNRQNAPHEAAIVFLDARTGKVRRQIAPDSPGVQEIAFSPDGTLIAAVCSRRELPDEFPEANLRVWEVNGGRPVQSINPPDADDMRQKYFTTVAFAPDGKSLLTSSSSDSLIEWDLATGKERRRIGSELINCRDLVFSPGGKLVAVAGPLATIRVIDWATGRAHPAGGGHYFGMEDVAVTPDGRNVATVGAAGRLSLWDLSTGRERNHVQAPSPYFVRLARDGGSAYAFESYDPYKGGQKAIVALDLATGRQCGRVPLDFAAGEHSFHRFCLGEKGLALTDYAGRAVHLLDPVVGKYVASLRDPEMRPRFAEFADGGRLLVAFCTDHTAFVWDVAKRTKVRQIKMVDDRGIRKVRLDQLEARGYSTLVSPDGKWIYYGGWNGNARFFDTASGDEVHPYDNPPADLGGSVFSPDGRTRACGGSQSVRLIEVATGKERHCLTGHTSSTEHLRFSADGRTLVSAGWDTTALVWDLTGRRTGAVGDKPLSPAELDARWTALAGDDAAKAYDALRSLAAVPSQAVPYLGQHVHPVKPADEKLFAGLIADLDSDQFTVREKAAGELEKLGEVVLPVCRKVLAGRPSAEVCRRLETLVSKCEQERRTPSGESLRALRSLEVLERVGTPEARRLLEAIAKGVPEARLTCDAKASVERLARRPPTP
jgi:RNA polymerase sigma factor (sigma-70 family)